MERHNTEPAGIESFQRRANIRSSRSVEATVVNRQSELYLTQDSRRYLVMHISVGPKLLKILMVATLMFFAVPAYSQEEVQRITTACNASIRQMVFWCLTAGDTQGTITTRVEQESKCEKAKQLVDSHCYPVQIPKLACNSSLREMEIWCAGNAKLNVTAVVAYCEQSQRNIRLFCYR